MCRSADVGMGLRDKLLLLLRPVIYLLGCLMDVDSGIMMRMRPIAQGFWSGELLFRDGLDTKEYGPVSSAMHCVPAGLAVRANGSFSRCSGIWLPSYPGSAQCRNRVAISDKLVMEGETLPWLGGLRLEWWDSARLTPMSHSSTLHRGIIS